MFNYKRPSKDVSKKRNLDINTNHHNNNIMAKHQHNMSEEWKDTLQSGGLTKNFSQVNFKEALLLTGKEMNFSAKNSILPKQPGNNIENERKSISKDIGDRKKKPLTSRLIAQSNDRME